MKSLSIPSHPGTNPKYRHTVPPQNEPERSGKKKVLHSTHNFHSNIIRCRGELKNGEKGRGSRKSTKP